jgi:ubiquinone/menaquinone biosynthesis C-methylase UbiE
MTTRTYWDRIAPRYARRPVADPAAYDAKLARVRALLRARDRMLEIGCGTGSTALTLAPAVSEIVATDLSEGMIAIAEGKRADAEISNVRFLRAGAGDILPGAPFDVIAAFSLLHLVEDVPAVLDAVRAQLKPGGLFLSKTVCLGDANAALRLFVRILGLVGIAPRVTVLSKSELRHALVRAGFDLVESRFFGKGRLNPFIVAQRPA